MTIVRIYNVEPKYRREAILTIFKRCQDEIQSVDVLTDSTLVQFRSPQGASLAKEILNGLAYPGTQLRVDILREKPEPKPDVEVEFSNLPLQFYDFDLRQLIEKYTGEDPGEQFYDEEIQLQKDRYGASQFVTLRAYDHDFGKKCVQTMDRQYVQYLDLDDCQQKIQQIRVACRQTRDGTSMNQKRRTFRQLYGFDNKDASSAVQGPQYANYAENDSELVEQVLQSSQQFISIIDSMSRGIGEKKTE